MDLDGEVLEPLTANCFSIYEWVSDVLDLKIFCGFRRPYILEVVRLLGVEIGWCCHRHGGSFATKVRRNL
jgi:hypothetical protein